MESKEKSDYNLHVIGDRLLDGYMFLFRLCHHIINPPNLTTYLEDWEDIIKSNTILDMLALSMSVILPPHDPRYAPICLESFTKNSSEGNSITTRDAILGSYDIFILDSKIDNY